MSRDGSTIAYASLDWRSTLLRVELDAKREAIVGAPVPILKSTRPIRDHEISPDGQWVVFNESGAQEDLFVARTDGTQYRRLTDDTFRDRGPDLVAGRQTARVLFGSKRQLRAVDNPSRWQRPRAGHGIRRRREFLGVVARRLASRVFRREFQGLLRHSRPLRKELPSTSPEPAAVGGLDFWPFSWSPDGARIAGALRRSDGTPQGLAAYVVATKKYEVVPNVVADSLWMVPTWLGDSRRLIVRDSHGISIVDATTGATRRLLAVRGYAVGRSVGVSRDNRWVTYTETGTEGDIWIATLRQPSR